MSTKSPKQGSLTGRKRALIGLALVSLCLLVWQGSRRTGDHDKRVNGRADERRAADGSDAESGGAAAALRDRLQGLDRLTGLRLPKSAGGDTVLRVLVIDPRGVPVPGATVDGRLLEGDLLAPPAPVVTDRAGMARLRLALPMGGHVSGSLFASAGDRRAVSQWIEASYPDQRQWAIQIELGQTSFLRGSVIVDGLPVAGARLQARADGGDAVFAHTVSGPDGRFELPVAAPASYRLSAEYQGITGMVRDIVMAADDRERIVEVVLASRQIAVLVRDPEQRPLAGVEVRNPATPGALAMTDASGRATVRGSVLGDAIALEFARDGFQPSSSNIYLDEPAPSPLEITLVPAMELAGDVDAPPDAMIELWAQRVDDDGEGGRISVAVLRQPGPFRSQVDAEDGRYEIGGYVEGVGEIIPRTVELRRGSLADAGQLAAETARGQLTGSVTDENGRPLAGAQIKIRRYRGRAVLGALTDAQGRFSLELPVGEYNVAAFAGPRYLGRNDATVGAGLSEVHFETPECTRWSLPSFDRVTDEGIVVVEALTSGLNPGDRIMQMDGADVSEASEILDSPDPRVLDVISSSGHAFQHTIVPICIL